MGRGRELLAEHVDDIARAINLCMDQGHVLPTLVLIYASIDILASLGRPAGQEDVSRAHYVGWAEKYLLPAGNIPCTGLEIYAARCALLHTYGAESRLSRRGRGSPGRLRARSLWWPCGARGDFWSRHRSCACGGFIRRVPSWSGEVP